MVSPQSEHGSWAREDVAALVSEYFDGGQAGERFESPEEAGHDGTGAIHRALQLSTKRVVTLEVTQAGPSGPRGPPQRT